MTTARHTDQDRELDALLARASLATWKGPDHSPRVDQFLKELHMRSHATSMRTRSVILVAAGTLFGGAVAAAVTHQVITHRARIIADDGTAYDVELTPTPDGAGGTFVTDDGTVYGINMTESGGERRLSVDVDSAGAGAHAVTVDGAATMHMLLAPGQQGRMEVVAPTQATFTDENGVTHQVDPAAVEGWVSDD